MSSFTLSLDLREHVVTAVSTGPSRRQVAARFGVSTLRSCCTNPQYYCQSASGDRLSHQIEVQAEHVNALMIAQKDDQTGAKILT
ncbi:hypothetical protein [Gluconobacter albidus]|uniref:Transposase n=1 Tax=Gluconobacter albidus TaxID=318683 RepID=A0ABQ5WZK0_9PROT|nr:hypothetical protein [Gluconobacter albidus]GBQ92744.1 transposase [Gluconobacter albidus NBRC 3250]GLQ68996.1 hypothetical protein GCM10007866_14470 [Gluconobacter albidus]